MIFKHFHLQNLKRVACILSPFYADTLKQNSVQSIVSNHLLEGWSERVSVCHTHFMKEWQEGEKHLKTKL